MPKKKEEDGNSEYLIKLMLHRCLYKCNSYNFSLPNTTKKA